MITARESELLMALREARAIIPLESEVYAGIDALLARYAYSNGQ